MNKINSLVIESDEAASQYLLEQIGLNFPELDIKATASTIRQACSAIDSYKPNIILSEVCVADKTIFEIYDNVEETDFEIILISENTEAAPAAIKIQACGYLLKPVKKRELISSLETAITKIRLAKDLSSDLSSLPHQKIIGIPTLEGYEFLNVSDIIRCEGQQKCTRVVTIQQNNIFSSYPIGKFRELLQGFGFFLCHKSHLINLSCVRKCTHEGFIYLVDESSVPLARRRKSQFLSLLKLL